MQWIACFGFCNFPYTYVRREARVRMEAGSELQPACIVIHTLDLFDSWGAGLKFDLTTAWPVVTYCTRNLHQKIVRLLFPVEGCGLSAKEQRYRCLFEGDGRHFALFWIINVVTFHSSCLLERAALRILIDSHAIAQPTRFCAGNMAGSQVIL